jgi:hypothetical protein
MVYILDEGSEFDAPIEKVWQYLQSQSHSHPSIKTLGREVEGNSVTLTSERNILGKTHKVKVKNTIFRPFGLVQEYLEGPFAGSKAFLYYIPKGNKTGVTIVGDYVMKDVDDDTVRRAVLTQAQIVFDEDNTNLKTNGA